MRSDWLIDFHTHHPHSNEHWSMMNLHEHFEKTNAIFQYSAGLHPCHLNEKVFESAWENLKIHSIKKNIIAIGECGLDRLHPDNYRLQEKAFVRQIRWANEISKPLIIHSVRTQHEIIRILRENGNQMPFIFHGFNNNIETAEMILNTGGYLSFGKSLFNPSIEKSFNNTPLNRLFLETDDSEYTIEQIYKQAARIRNTTIDQINNQIKNNLTAVFNIIL